MVKVFLVHCLSRNKSCFFLPKDNDVLSLMCFYSRYIEYLNFIQDILIFLLSCINDLTSTNKASGSVTFSKE